MMDGLGSRLSPNRKVISIRDVVFGHSVEIVEPVNLYGCEIESDCFIGPFVEIQRGTRIGRGSKIQSHTFICEGVTIGRGCFIAHGVMFINDRFSGGRPARGDISLWENTIIGSRVSIGSNSTILPVTICDDVVIGAGSVVTRDIVEPGFYAGNPARFLRGHNEK